MDDLLTLGGLDQSACQNPDQMRADVGRLYELRRTFVYKTLLRFTRDEGVAEELTQEGFFRLYQNYTRGAPVANAVGWVVTVARNLAKDRLRNIRRHRVPDETDWQIFIETCRDDAPSPEDAVIDNQIQGLIRNLMETLPKSERKCVMLYAEGSSFTEISTILNMPYHRVLVDTRLGLLKIKRLLATKKR
jgi:RNA polymerase sigma-70 factor (ECF subfamily)